MPKFTQGGEMPTTQSAPTAPLPETVGAFLKRHSLTQGELATRLGVRPPTVSRWLSGVRPKANEVLIARALRDLERELLRPEGRPAEIVDGVARFW